MRTAHPARPRRTARLLLRTVTAAALALAGATLAGPPADAAGPLSVDAGADVSVAEGTGLVRAVTILDATDDGEPGWTYEIDPGDGSAVVQGTTLVASVPVDHRYADGPDLHTLTVTVTDVPGETAVDTVAVTVTNVAPTPVVSGPATVTEGSTYSLGVDGTDPAGPADPLLYFVEWGEGGFGVQVFRPAGTFQHTYPDDADGPENATARTILVQGYDGSDLGFTTLPVTIRNVPPTVAVSGPASVAVGAAYSLVVGPVVDPGRDTVTSRVVRWGDGTTSAVPATGGTLDHVYTAAGTRAVSVEVVDEDGTWPSAGATSVRVGLVAPDAPTGLSATTVGRTSVGLAWDPFVVVPGAIVVQRCRGVGCTSFTTVATVAGTATGWTSRGLSPRTSYSFRVRARNAAGVSPWSATVSVVTAR